jgi:hypothetical protein
VSDEDFDGLLGLALARLDQQVAARFQPSLRRGGHPPLDVKPVHAAIERRSRLVHASLRG